MNKYIILGIIIGIMMIGFVNGTNYNDCKVYGNCKPSTTTINFNNNTGSVNNTIFWQGHTGTDGSWLTGIGNEWWYNQTTATYNLYNSIWTSTYNATYDTCINNASYLSTYNATYDAKADYQFATNNFNGSGNITTSGNIHTDKNFSSGNYNGNRQFYVNLTAGEGVFEGAGYVFAIYPITGGPYITFGTPAVYNAYMAVGAYSGVNNIYNAGRTLRIYGTSDQGGLNYLQTGGGRWGFGLTPTGNAKITINQSLTIISNITSNICNATNEGMIYYDGILKRHMGCNSTAWNALY